MATSTDLVADKATALRRAQQMGCSGAHQHPDGKWMPCSTMAEYEKLRGDSGKNTVEVIEQRQRYRSAKGKNKRNGWERLGERGLTSIDTIAGGGLTGGRSGSIKAAGGWAPDDEDPDVFTNARSARRRARQLGCIGIARRTSRNGKIVWTPCSNMTDYAKRTGSTAFGRHHQRRRARRTLERAVAREVRRQLRRKKSLMETLYEGKALGRKLRTAASRFDPNAVDADMDMLVQEGTPWERPARPKVPGSRRAERRADRIGLQSSLAKQPRARGLASLANSAEELRKETLSKVKRRDNSEKTIHWVFGTPGSGKSTLIKTGDLKAPPADEAAHVDPDDYKRFHPKWNSGTGAHETHPWSVGQAEHTMVEADKAGMDLVVQGTGKNGALINRFIQERGDYRKGRRENVTSVAHLVYAPQKESERRLHDRGQRRGHDDQRARLTGTLRDRAEIQEKMARYITEGRFDETHIYDNSGVEGAPAPLIATQRADGTYEILDQEKFEDFFGNPETAARVEEYWKGLGDSKESLGNTFRRTRKREGLKSRIDDSFEDKYGKEAPRGDGDCFTASLLAGRELESGGTDNNGNLVSNIRVVNGSPLGVGGNAKGLRFPHGWIEYDVELPTPPELPEDLLERVPPEMREGFAELIRKQNELAEAVRTQMADRGKVTMVRDYSNVKKGKDGLPISFQKMDREKLTSQRPDYLKEDYYKMGNIEEGDILGNFSLDEYETLTDQFGAQHFSQKEATELLTEIQGENNLRGLASRQTPADEREATIAVISESLEVAGLDPLDDEDIKKLKEAKTIAFGQPTGPSAARADGVEVYGSNINLEEGGSIIVGVPEEFRVAVKRQGVQTIVDEMTPTESSIVKKALPDDRVEVLVDRIHNKWSSVSGGFDPGALLIQLSMARKLGWSDEKIEREIFHAVPRVEWDEATQDFIPRNIKYADLKKKAAKVIKNLSERREDVRTDIRHREHIIRQRATGRNTHEHALVQALVLEHYYGEAYQAVLAAEQRATVKRLKARGVEKLTLYRGVIFGESEAEHLDALIGQPPQSLGADRPGSALTSWSITEQTARGFADMLSGANEPGLTGYVIKSEVPIDDIVGLSTNGFGCVVEGECIVRHGKQTIQVLERFPG